MFPSDVIIIKDMVLPLRDNVPLVDYDYHV